MGRPQGSTAALSGVVHGRQAAHHHHHHTTPWIGCHVQGGRQGGHTHPTRPAQPPARTSHRSLGLHSRCPSPGAYASTLRRGPGPQSPWQAPTPQPPQQQSPWQPLSPAPATHDIPDHIRKHARTVETRKSRSACTLANKRVGVRPGRVETGERPSLRDPYPLRVVATPHLTHPCVHSGRRVGSDDPRLRNDMDALSITPVQVSLALPMLG